MKEFNKISEEVFYANKSNFSLNSDSIKYLVDLAKKSERKRARLCIHKNNDSHLHEMFIAKLNNTFVRPHKNLYKCKSFEVLEGEIDLVLFDNLGNITDVIKLLSYGHKCNFFYRLTTTCYHTLIIKSNHAIFKETITGPFNNRDTVYADWAPMENDKVKVKKYMKCILNEIAKSFNN
jgi:cupin fold WbuC family metalloprotein